MVTKRRTNSIELHTHTSSSLLKNKKIEDVKSKIIKASLKDSLSIVGVRITEKLSASHFL